jgi:hypothetical protein
MLNLPESLALYFGYRRVVAKPTFGGSTDGALCDRANQFTLKAVYAKSLLFIFYGYKPKREIITKQVSHLVLNLPFLFEIAQVSEGLPFLTLHEVNLPYREIRVVQFCKNYSAYILAEDAAVMWRRLVSVKCHPSIIEQIVF